MLKIYKELEIPKKNVLIIENINNLIDRIFGPQSSQKSKAIKEKEESESDEESGESVANQF